MATSAPGNQSRDSPMVMSRKTRAVKRPQASSASIFTEKGWRPGRGFGSVECQLACVNAVYCCCLARDAVVVHRVDAVGGDVHFVERAVAWAEVDRCLRRQCRAESGLRRVGRRRRRARAGSSQPFGQNFHCLVFTSRVSVRCAGRWRVRKLARLVSHLQSSTPISPLISLATSRSLVRSACSLAAR